jgi:hypothetical protein
VFLTDASVSSVRMFLGLPNPDPLVRGMDPGILPLVLVD